jgi:hypothetical protein
MRGLSEQRAGSRSYSTQSLGPEEPTYRATPPVPPVRGA